MTEEIKQTKIQNKVVASFMSTNNGYTWSPTDVDKLEVTNHDDFAKVVSDCRFFYKHDPIASTVINKLVEIAINDITFDKGGLSDNEYRIFTGIKDKLLEFMEACALEYLISGLVIPEVEFAPAQKEYLTKLGIKKYPTLSMPKFMWLRDPTLVKINQAFQGEPSFYIKIPDELRFFIVNAGVYPDGTKDVTLYQQLLALYPELINLVKQGGSLSTIYIPLENPLIVRRRPITGSPYPIPYLDGCLESLKHKRNLRRMDYSIAARVISGIQLFNLGSDEYPVTEDDGDAFSAIRDQMYWRNSGEKDVERVFQLFANHTLKITWVTPPVEVLLDDTKYAEINRDIFLALGFPRILTTGETDKSQTSEPDFAMISPTKTLESIQVKLLPILSNIVYRIADENNIKTTPVVRFEKINLYSVSELTTVLSMLYEGGNISRETLDREFGYTYQDELDKRIAEEKEIRKSGVPEFSPKPFSEQPENGTSNKPGGMGSNEKTGTKTEKKLVEEDK